MDVKAFFESEFSEHEDVMGATRAALREPFAQLVTACVVAIKGGNKVILFGNGGSAADSQHLAAEFACRFAQDRPSDIGL